MQVTLLSLNWHRVCQPFAKIKALVPIIIGNSIQPPPCLWYNDWGVKIDLREDFVGGSRREEYSLKDAGRTYYGFISFMALRTHYNISQHLLRYWKSMLNRICFKFEFWTSSPHSQPSFLAAQLKKQSFQFLRQFILDSSSASSSKWWYSNRDHKMHLA